jgi:hypothetical protein
VRCSLHRRLSNALAGLEADKQIKSLTTGDPGYHVAETNVPHIETVLRFDHSRKCVIHKLTADKWSLRHVRRMPRWVYCDRKPALLGNADGHISPRHYSIAVVA